jgi:hypothetical protein
MKSTRESPSSLHDLILEQASERQIQTAIRGGANVDARDDAGNTALHYACSANYVEGIRTLIKAGAEVAIKNNDGKTPINLIEPVQMQGSSAGAGASPERHQKSVTECDAARDAFVEAVQQRARHEARMKSVYINEKDGVAETRRNAPRGVGRL